MRNDKKRKQEWLLFFYSIPSKPVSNRMKIWRMLVKAGAVQFKGSVYILPASDDHYELFQWLVSSAAGMKGEAAFVRVSEIETMKDAEIIELFDQQRDKDYLDIGMRLDELENKIGSIKKGTEARNYKKIKNDVGRITKDFHDIARIDFFTSKGQKELEHRLKIISSEIADMTTGESVNPVLVVIKRYAAEYQCKTWVTRKRPFIDRIASAWLIKRFIDKKAAFSFIDESEIEGLGKDSIAYDMVGAEFTHVGDMCTFEVLLKSFGLKDKALGILAEIVHQLDVQDDRYRQPAAEGLREILDGIRRTVNDDHEALDKGMNIFEMLYTANR